MGKLLDLTAVEEDRRQVRIDDGPVEFMASPDDIGPRDFARISAMQKYTEVSPDTFDEDTAEGMEAAMTAAARIVLPDTDPERVAAMSFMRKARLVSAFVSGLRSQPSAPEPNREDRRRMAKA